MSCCLSDHRRPRQTERKKFLDVLKLETKSTSSGFFTAHEFVIFPRTDRRTFDRGEDQAIRNSPFMVER
jgi:hypothetical protein